MKPRSALLFLAVTGLAFAAGVWCGPWLLKKSSAARAVTSGPARTGPAPLTGGSSAATIILDPVQSKADSRLAIESPQAFLDSLRGESGLKAQARIAAAMAEMPLVAVQELAKKVEAMGYGGGPVQWQFSWAVFERWSELDADGLLLAARQSPNRMMGYQGISAAFRHIARRDPDAAWKQAQDQGQLTYYSKQSVLQTIGETDPAGALRLVTSDAASRRDSWSASSFMQSWLMRDRDAALSALTALPSGEFRAGLISQLSSGFAAADPAAALAWSQTLKNPAEKNQAMSAAIEEIARLDPRKAITMMDDPAFAQQRRQGLTSAVSAWARKDFDAAFSFVLGTKSPADQQQMLSSLSNEATAAQRIKLLEIAKTLPPSSAKSIYQSALDGSVYATGVDPSEIIDQITSTSIREDLIKRVVENGYSTSTEEMQKLFGKLQSTSQTTDQASNLARRLAYSDPAAAVKWAEGLGSADLKNSALKSALQTWAYSDPQAAAQKAMGVSDATQRAEMLRGIAGTWAGSDDKAAMAWAQSLPGADRAAALGALVQNSLQASPQQAQELYAKFSASLDAEAAAKPDNKGVARSMASTLAENDPQQALTWATSLAPGGAQNEAFAGIAEKWAGYDAAATSEWIGTLPAGEGRDLAAEKLVSTIARDDPDSAWAWATSIADATKRREAAARVLEAWKGYGKTDTARDSLDAAGFSADDAKELAKKLE